MNIGSNICKLRKDRKMSQRELANVLGVTLQAVSKWENGISEPSAKCIALLYKLFGDKLFAEEVEPEKHYVRRPNMSGITEIYKVGRGPSSSHTIGPERACRKINELHPNADKCRVTLYGSLAKTGKGHRTDYVIRESLNCRDVEVYFDEITGVEHPNTLRFEIYESRGKASERAALGVSGESAERTALGIAGTLVTEHTVLSIGGGDIVFDGTVMQHTAKVYPHTHFAEISEYCKKENIALWEYAYRFEKDLPDYLNKVWKQMVSSVKAGLADEGVLPGGLHVQKKARQLFESEHVDETAETKSNRLICAYAFAVSEQNASAQTIVTAPTCGAAGVLPAVLYYEQQKHKYSEEKICHALATAGIVGNIIKTNASISGAECGCQAEIGSACAMAAAALGELFELSIDKIEYAAEIALEHHLGLTCDPVCGLVQIPCIERNAVAAMRAINAVNLSSLLWQTRKISLDKIVKTMKETGNDLPESYRETAEGGLAKNYTE